MRFIRNSDYLFKITDYDFETLSDNNDFFVSDAELKAQAIIELYLRKRYDLPVLFQSYPDYISGTTYTTGQRVWFGTGSTEFLYTPTGTTSTSPTSINWLINDSRNASIIDWMTTISLYKLHERVSPNNIPTHRKDSFTLTMQTLKMIQEGKLSPDFPEITDRLQNIYITGSTSQGTFFY